MQTHLAAERQGRVQDLLLRRRQRRRSPREAAAHGDQVIGRTLVPRFTLLSPLSTFAQGLKSSEVRCGWQKL